MKNLFLMVMMFIWTGCTQTTVVSQPVKLPNKCGNYDLVYGTLKADGVLVTLVNKELKMTPIGLTEAQAPVPLSVGDNVGKKALVKGIYGGDRLYRAEIVEIVDLHNINVQAIEAQCNRVDPQIQKPAE